MLLRGGNRERLVDYFYRIIISDGAGVHSLSRARCGRLVRTAGDLRAAGRGTVSGEDGVGVNVGGRGERHARVLSSDPGSQRLFRTAPLSPVISKLVLREVVDAVSVQPPAVGTVPRQMI
jgi:hypothetical protein